MEQMYSEICELGQLVAISHTPMECDEHNSLPIITSTYQVEIV